MQAARAAGWLVAARIALTVVSYGRARDRAARLRTRSARGSRMTAGEAARALERAARVLPATTCLARSLAAECLLRREGWPASVQIGVALDPDRTLRAHAWVESGGILVCGGDERASFAPLTSGRP